MQGHGLGIGGGHDERGGGAAFGADGAEQIGPFVAPVARCAWTASASRPDPGQCALLTDARFVLEPDFERLAFGPLRERIANRLAEVFLKASWACGSAFGCCGRTESRR